MTNRYPKNANRLLTAAACFAAALALTACGGESLPGDSRLDSTVPYSERESATDNSPSDNSGSGSQAGTDDNGSTEDSSRPEDSEDSSSTDEIVDGGETGAGNDNPDSGVDDDSDVAEQTPPASENPDQTSSHFALRWGTPNKRENGEDLDLQELKGYEIRYRQGSDSEFQSHTIEDGGLEWIYVDDLGDGLNGDYEYQIAVYDVDGLYSEFVNLTPYEES